MEICLKLDWLEVKVNCILTQFAVVCTHWIKAVNSAAAVSAQVTRQKRVQGVYEAVL